MIEFDLKECISFGLGVIKRFLVLDSVFVLPEEFDNFFFVSPTEVLRCPSLGFFKPRLGLFGPRCFENNRPEPGHSSFRFICFYFIL